jgi:C-terminal peptidase prc
MTRAKLSRVLGCFIAALAIVTTLRAAEAPKTPPKTYAVIVGVSKYKDEQIKQRPHAEDDAKALYELISSPANVGADPKNVTLLLGQETTNSNPATRQNILDALKKVTTLARPNDLVYFVFIGEGGPLGDAGDRRCYFASDSTFAEREKTAVGASEIGDILKNLKSQHFVGFIDVDFKGFTAKTAITEPRLGETPYKEFLGDDGSDDHLPLPGRVLYLATNGLHTGIDLDKHGLFAQVVLDGLKGGADVEGYEPDGVITVDELTKYFDKNMSDLARKFGKTNEDKQQAHFVLGGSASHYILGNNPAASAQRSERLAALAKLEGKLTPKLADEGKTLLERMPKLEAQRSLRKEFQKYVDGKINLEQLRDNRDAILAKTRMSEVDAVRFARKVMGAIDIIKENHVKKVSAEEMTGWAVRGLYKKLDEPVPAELEAKLKGLKGVDDAEKLTLVLAEMRQTLGKREDLDDHHDLDWTLQTMLRNLDPYTTYIDPEQLAKFKQDTQGYFNGIGIQIRKDAVSDRLLVVTPIKDSPAYKAGLEPGDIIKTVIRDVDSDGEKLNPAEVIDTKGLQLQDAVKKILGKAGTDVKLVVERDGKDLTITLTRAQIQTESVLGVKRKANDDWDYMLDDKNKIAYIRLTSFQRNSYRDMQKVMESLVKEQKIKGFVLDLRFDPGGLLDSAVKISDLFIDDGLIVSVRPRVGRETRFTGFREGSLLDFPMVCMVNGMSASGSEIVSAALQDHRRAYIIGERSYGKGSVQNIQQYEGGEIKLTTASFWRPSNKNLNKSSTSGKDEDEWGVTPDKVIKLTPTERDDLFESQHNSEICRRGKAPKEKVKEFQDRQLEAAVEYLQAQIKMAKK